MVHVGNWEICTTMFEVQKFKVYHKTTNALIKENQTLN
jgi:lauroyl/myristoyl acyltransferase